MSRIVRRLVVIPCVLAVLAFGLPSLRAQGDRRLEAAEFQAVLDDFKSALDERWSYRHANDADFDAAIKALRAKAEARMSIDELGVELQKILALGIDGHSAVIGYQLPGRRYLPFLIEPAGERFAAFRADHSAFLADGFPYLSRIDGRDVGWCAAVAALVSKGSPQYRLHRCLSRLRNIDFARTLMALPAKDVVDVTLLGRDGKSRKLLSLPVGDAAPPFEPWPRAESRVLDQNVGYLRLATMGQESSVQEIKKWMPKFRGTSGLVVDVRDNNGGERDALQLIYTYLAAPGDPPRVFTAAAYRLHAAHSQDHLAANHHMYRIDAPEWSSEQRRAVAQFARSFKPEWEPPKGQFSDWHYMALTRADDKEIDHYDKPVVVLMNGKCFSATDIFLAGLRGMKNVLLLGTPSGGGSAFTQDVTLGATPLRLRIGSMASFQADGRLYDTHGIPPDVVVEPTPEYYIGGPDNALNEATRWIANSRIGR